MSIINIIIVLANTFFLWLLWDRDDRLGRLAWWASLIGALVNLAVVIADLID